MIQPSTSILRPASNGDAIKTRKIDKIKQKLVEILRESFQHLKHVLNQSTTMYTGEIGFKLSNCRLPWSTLDGDLRRKGYIIVNWPQGVSRDRDEGLSGLSADAGLTMHFSLTTLGSFHAARARS